MATQMLDWNYPEKKKQTNKDKWKYIVSHIKYILK